MVNFSKAFTADQIEMLNMAFQENPQASINPVMKLIGSTNWAKVKAYKISGLWADWQSDTLTKPIEDIPALLLSARTRIGPLVTAGERIMLQAKEYLHSLDQIEIELASNELTNSLLERLALCENELKQTRGELDRARERVDFQQELTLNRVRNQETHGEATR